MKIVYITEVNLDIPSGVLHKLNEQVGAWVNEGNEVYVISIPSILKDDESPLLLTPRAAGFYIYKNKYAQAIFSKGILNFVNKTLSVSSVRNFLKVTNPDVIYLREMVAFPRMKNMFVDYPVILESNTLLAEELRLAGLKLLLFFKLFQSGVNKRINGFVGVTEEITNTYLKYSKESITVTNSVEINPGVQNVSTKNDMPQIIFVGSPDCAWHGIDKFVKMVRLLPQYSFILVGPVIPNLEIANLQQMGFLNKEELVDVYRKIDIGIGTLALHRKGMKEACPLKVREYLSLGIPTIIAYEDKDLKNQDFVLEIENTETSIEDNIIRIQAFIEQWKGQRVVADKVYPLISTKVKENERLDFMQKIRFS